MTTLTTTVTSSISSSSSSSILPVWLPDTDSEKDENDGAESCIAIDPAWMSCQLNMPVKKCTVVCDISNAGRKGERIRDSGTLQLRVALYPDDNDSNSSNTPKVMFCVLKQQATRLPFSQQLGLPREALFYQHFVVGGDSSASSSKSSFLKDIDCLPRIWYAAGDMNTGVKCILMEDLSHPYSSTATAATEKYENKMMDSGIFFGPGNPNNWTRNLPALIQNAFGGANDDQDTTLVPTAGMVAKETFCNMAKIHAKFWKRDDVLLHAPDMDWLRGQAWLRGIGQDSWEASQSIIQQSWNSYLLLEQQQQQEQQSSLCIQWDPLIRAIVEKAVAGISWQSQLERLHPHAPYTLVHGDFWPGNVMWMIQHSKPSGDGNDNDNTSNNSNNIRLLDWEMVGVGSGPQDLGQYILSNMDPVERQACEKDLIESYHQELIKQGVLDVSLEYCWKEYTVGGLERWIWFLLYFLGLQTETMTAWAQFFHNQMAAMAHDHSISPADIVQPRP